MILLGVFFVFFFSFFCYLLLLFGFDLFCLFVCVCVGGWVLFVFMLLGFFSQDKDNAQPKYYGVFSFYLTKTA